MKIVCFTIAFFAFSSKASAEHPTMIGLNIETISEVSNDFLWYKLHARYSNALKVLSTETMGPKPNKKYWISDYLLNHFPLVISDNQKIRICPQKKEKCKLDNFENWPYLEPSIQNTSSNMIGLHTPYLDRNFETSIIGFTKNRLLSVSNRNQTIAVINEDEFMDFDESFTTEYKRWVRLSQWMALSRLHQIFSSEGKALKQCRSETGTKYICEVYDNGVLYFSGVTLLAGSIDCSECTEREKALLRIMAFDKLVRTGKSEKSDKIISYIEKDMLKLMKLDQENPLIIGIIDMYKDRYYANNSAESFVP